MNVDRWKEQWQAVRVHRRFLRAAAIVLVCVMSVVSFLRGLLRHAPSGARARAALVAGRPDEARRLAQTADELSDGEDQEALAVIDELDLAAVTAHRSPRQRAEAALSLIPRTPAGRKKVEQMFLVDAEQAVLANDGSTIEEIRFAVRTWPDGGTLSATLVALRELVVIQRCVNATKLVCASLFPPVAKRHPAVAARIEALRVKQVAHAAIVFGQSAALLRTKPDPSVAGAAQRDQVLAAAEHVALALPTERIDEIAAYAATHQVSAFHATPPR